jgi:hypothetical protein
LLQKGVRIDGTDLQRIARRHLEALARHLQTVLLEGRPADPDPLLFLTLADRQVHLTVTVIADTRIQP